MKTWNELDKMDNVGDELTAEQELIWKAVKFAEFSGHDIGALSIFDVTENELNTILDKANVLIKEATEDEGVSTSAICGVVEEVLRESGNYDAVIAKIKRMGDS